MESNHTNLTGLAVVVDGLSADLTNQLTISEVSLTESLSLPGLVSTIIVQSATNTDRQNQVTTAESQTPIKNLDEYYGKKAGIVADRPIIRDLYGDTLKSTFTTSQTIYRLSNRVKVNYNIEQFQLDLCDTSLLYDAKQYISKSWKNVTPDEIVRDVLAPFPNMNLEIEKVKPKQDYISNFLHPFQIVNQMADLSLSDVNTLDPSLVHFMTYQTIKGEDHPTHNYRSLTAMAKQEPVFNFAYSAKDTQDLNYSLPSDIMTYSFPLDFDLLSDLLNGVDETGKSFVQMNVLNTLSNKISTFGPLFGPVASLFSVLGESPWLEATNLGTEDIQNSAPMASEQIKILRRARMGLIEQSNLALRFTIPFAPFLNAGRTVTVHFSNTQNGTPLYGTGKYLIVNMTHNIKLGGMGTTTLECVSDSVSRGVA